MLKQIFEHKKLISDLCYFIIMEIMELSRKLVYVPKRVQDSNSWYVQRWKTF